MSNMAEMSVPEFVQTLANNFAAGWLAIETASVTDETRSENEIAMVNRMVELLSWYLIQGLLQDSAAGNSVHQDLAPRLEASLKTWKAILSGWSTSIESHDLSQSSVKLLKLVVLSEKLKTYKEQRRTATTYAEIAKLLFCISKFPELKDTQEQETVADLCAEAKSLEMLFMMRSQELCSYSEKWERRAEAFAPSVRRAVLNIIKERLEIPPMFASRVKELTKNLDSIPDREGSVEIADGSSDKSDQLVLPGSVTEVMVKEEAKSPAPSVEGTTAIGVKVKVESAEHEGIDVEMKNEEEEVVMDNGAPSSNSGSSDIMDEPVSILQLPYVSETIQWSSDESCDLQSGEFTRSSSYRPLQVTGGTSVGTSRQWSSASTSSSTSGGRVKWTDEEVELLKEGVERFGISNWKVIRQNYPFHSRRTNVDLKDKWRNLQKKQ